MIVLLTAIAAVVAGSLAATVRGLVTDGYRRVPTRPSSASRIR